MCEAGVTETQCACTSPKHPPLRPGTKLSHYSSAGTRVLDSLMSHGKLWRRFETVPIYLFPLFLISYGIGIKRDLCLLSLHLLLLIPTWSHNPSCHPNCALWKWFRMSPNREWPQVLNKSKGWGGKQSWCHTLLVTSTCVSRGRRGEKLRQSWCIHRRIRRTIMRFYTWQMSKIFWEILLGGSKPQQGPATFCSSYNDAVPLVLQYWCAPGWYQQDKKCG